MTAPKNALSRSRASDGRRTAKERAIGADQRPLCFQKGIHFPSGNMFPDGKQDFYFAIIQRLFQAQIQPSFQIGADQRPLCFQKGIHFPSGNMFPDGKQDFYFAIIQRLFQAQIQPSFQIQAHSCSSNPSFPQPHLPQAFRSRVHPRSSKPHPHRSRTHLHRSSN